MHLGHFGACGTACAIGSGHEAQPGLDGLRTSRNHASVACGSLLAGSQVITGIITTADVLRHPVTIAQLYGVRILWRCYRAILMRQHTTFLAIVFAEQ